MEVVSGSESVLSYSTTDEAILVKNTPGVALPNTGGPGTRIFTILGSILILGAGVLLWRRRRLI
ncbi:MAG: LPXTG cell wall anchor domain-containing protein [Oscillospiraceae bacterium]|nr:LPXTG cell wall anchor domain-containing protein [Oscillospiraceae bacterium]